MGCDSSKLSNGDRKSSINNGGRRNTLVVKPKAQIQASEGIQHRDEKGTILIFIFGGPGSGKGTIVNNLVDMFNFRFLCGEDLIMESLSKKMLPEGGSAMGTNATRELQKLVAEDSSQLTLHWVLDLLDQEICKYPGEVILVDMVPNLKFLLRVPELSKESTKELEAFEKKHPIAFAIDLALDSDHLIQNINQTHACTKAPKQGGDDKSSSSDEMDTSRTQRRFNIYINSVKEHLAYFKTANKLLTVDTSCGDIASVWDSVCEYVVDSEISKPGGLIENVVMFKFKADDFSEIDRQRYPMKDVSVFDIGATVNGTPVQIMRCLSKMLQEDAATWKTFMFNVEGTALSSTAALEQASSERLIFLDEQFGQLDYFIHGIKRHTVRKKSLARKKDQMYRALVTNNNEVLIFPSYVELSHCRQICSVYKQCI